MLGQLQVTVDVSYCTQNGCCSYVIKGTDTSLLGRDWMRYIHLDWKSIRERHRERQTDRETDRQRDRHREREKMFIAVGGLKKVDYS